MNACSSPNTPFFLVKDDDMQRLIVYKLRCKMSSCAACADYSRKCWHVRITKFLVDQKAQGNGIFFVTLTSHEKLRTFDACAAVYSSAWKKLYMRMRRIAEFQYVSIPEKHTDGRLHAHALVTLDITKRWLKDNARECGLGYQVEISPVVMGEGCGAYYITKYLGKNTAKEEWPKGFRRVRTSRNFPRLDAGEYPSASDGETVIGGSNAERLIARYEKNGYTAMNGHTGEIISMLAQSLIQETI